MTSRASIRLLALFAVFSLFATSGCQTINRAHYSYKRTKNHTTDPGYTPPLPPQVPPAGGQSPSAPALPTQ